MRGGRRFGRLRRRGAGSAVVVLAAASCLASVGSAGATPVGHPLRHITFPARTYLHAWTQASGGYRLTITAARTEVPVQESEDQRTSTFVSLRLSRVGSDAEYLGPGASFGADGAVAADWGAIGHLQARFVALRSIRKPIRWCNRRITVESGELMGVLAFRGEDGYATVRTARLPATLTREPEAVCHVPGSLKPHEQRESLTVAGISGRNGRLLGISALQHSALGTVTLLAYSSERRGDVSVTRQASGVAPLSALAIDPEAERATLDAPPPFTGSASFEAEPGKNVGAWLGNLTVNFPGERGVRLAGKRFEGSMLKPHECPDDSNACGFGIKLQPPVGLKPELPLDRSLPRSLGTSAFPALTPPRRGKHWERAVSPHGGSGG